MEINIDKCTEESLPYKLVNGTKVLGSLEFTSGGIFAFFRSTQNLSEVLSEYAVITTSSGFRVLGGVFCGIGALIGVGLGGFFTHKHCEEIIDKFVEFYKNNANKISNSYQTALEYLLKFSEVNSESKTEKKGNIEVASLDLNNGIPVYHNHDIKINKLEDDLNEKNENQNNSNSK